jgi:hypothetical protein
MKKIISLILVVAFINSVFATDFMLKSGIMVMGKLKGIKDGNMYVLDTNNQLHELVIDDITVINDGNGDVSSIWKRKKPFMDADIDQYQYASTVIDQQAYLAFQPVAGTEAKPIDQAAITNQHLKSISTALWVMNIVLVASVVTAFIVAEDAKDANEDLVNP